jgi:hypothetical protein
VVVEVMVMVEGGREGRWVGERVGMDGWMSMD